MKSRILDRSEWSGELIRLSRLMRGKDVMVEVAALNLGDQTEAEYVPLKGLSYDEKDDVVQLWVGEMDHLIRHPREIGVAMENDRLISIDIVDAEGGQHQVKPLEDVLLQ